METIQFMPTTRKTYDISLLTSVTENTIHMVAVLSQRADSVRHAATAVICTLSTEE